MYFVRKLLVTFALSALAAPAWAQSTEPQPTAVEAPAPLAPAPAPELPKKKGAPISVVYDGGTVFRTDDGKFELKLNGLLQTRLELTKIENIDPTTRFLIPRARLALQGFVWKNTQFKLETAVSDAGNTRLRDFFLNQVFLDGQLQVRAGQFKRPFNRQEIVSDFATAFLEKATTNNWVGVQGSRDLGIQLSNGYDRSPDGLEWAVGFFDGEGDATRYSVICPPATNSTTTCMFATPTNTPSDWQPQLVARVGWNLGGIKGYSEGDLEGGGFRLAVAASYRGQYLLRDQDTTPTVHDFETDFALKISGFDATGAFFIHKVKDTDAQFAVHVQAGYMVIPKTIQVALRYARIPLAAPAAGATQEYNDEYRIAFNWFFFESHSFKWATDFGYAKDTTDGKPYTLLFRTGAQMIF